MYLQSLRYVYIKTHYLAIDLDLGVEVTQNIAQIPLNHVTVTPAKFEVAMSNGLGEDTIIRKFRADAQMDGRPLDFCMKLILPWVQNVIKPVDWFKIRVSQFVLKSHQELRSNGDVATA